MQLTTVHYLLNSQSVMPETIIATLHCGSGSPRLWQLAQHWVGGALAAFVKPEADPENLTAPSTA